MKKAEPFLKWAGGKNQLLAQYKNLFPNPKTYNRYIEPFVGGGAVFFYLQGLASKKSIISDLNKDLINCYEVIRSSPEPLISEIENHIKNHNKEYYYKLRDKYNLKEIGKIERAAIFIYLNKASFNGLHRVNRKGEFNVPIGKDTINKNSVDRDNILAIRDVLKGTKIIVSSYEKVITDIREDDFYYLDPPYFPLNGRTSFTKYTNFPFLESEHKKLASIVKKIHSKGAKLMLSNSDTPFIRSLYDNNDFIIYPIKAKRYINCLGSRRNGSVDEVAILNYKCGEEI